MLPTSSQVCIGSTRRKSGHIALSRSIISPGYDIRPLRLQWGAPSQQNQGDAKFISCSRNCIAEGLNDASYA